MLNDELAKGLPDTLPRALFRGKFIMLVIRQVKPVSDLCAVCLQALPGAEAIRCGE
jgi:hypothetical protein